MKKVFTNVLKGLLVIILFTGTSVVLFTSDVRTVSEAQAQEGQSHSQAFVTEAQVIEYLEEYGYEVVSCSPKPNTIGNWVAHTILDGKHYHIVIAVSGNNIVGYSNENNIIGNEDHGL
jgi:hypothetical protein